MKHVSESSITKDKYHFYGDSTKHALLRSRLTKRCELCRTPFKILIYLLKKFKREVLES